MMERVLGRSGIAVSAMGMGCWAIGGECWEGDQPVGWGTVDDRESLAALDCGITLGVNFFDTSNVYGAGHSERLLGRALAGRRDKVVIATKFGNTFDEATRRKGTPDASPAHIRSSCEASLQRLNTDYIDLYFFHLNVYEAELVGPVLEMLEDLVREGKIRCYGWSTDCTERAAAFAKGKHCAAIEHNENIFNENPAMLRLCEEQNLASVNRAPLAMGLLSGKYDAGANIRDNDIRGVNSPMWIEYFRGGKPSEELLRRLDNIRGVLTEGGRTLVQGALGWIWARSGRTVPIPGFRTVAQVKENAGAMAFGPISIQQMEAIDEILARP